MPLLERTPPRVVHPIPPSNHVVVAAKSPLPAPLPAPAPAPAPALAPTPSVVSATPASPNRQEQDSRKDDEIEELKQTLSALRKDLDHAQEAQRRAKEEAEGWAAECEVLQRKQASLRSTVEQPSFEQPNNSSEASQPADSALLQLQRKDLEKAMATLYAEQHVARVSTEYASLLASTETAHTRDAVAAIGAQFATMRCEFARRRAERKLQRLMQDSREDLDHLNNKLTSARRELEEERSRASQLQTQLTKSNADLAEHTEKKRKLNSHAADSSLTITGGHSVSHDHVTEQPAPPPKRGPGRPRKAVAETQKVNPATSSLPLVNEEEELDEDEVERSILYVPPVRPKPRPVKAGSARDASETPPQPVRSKATAKSTTPVDSIHSTFADSSPRRKPASKGTHATDGPAAVSTTNKSRSHNKENVDPVDGPVKSSKKKSKAKAQESDEDDMDDDGDDDDFVSTTKRPSAATKGKKRKDAPEESVPPVRLTESITVPAVTPVLTAKKPKKQRRLGGANAGGGVGGSGTGLSFLSGPSHSGAAGALNAKAGAQTNVNEMRKNWNKDETALLNPSSELGLPLALSPLKPGSNANGRGRGFGNLGRGLPSFLSRSGF
ncbi:hypothetical protein OC861_000917 [Tilletia horrida]|nr:hypothetical protein OC845_000744 [Tilletia horrida]KAK0569429.1 hypothetical protein OC861_000917 [Tilletia horrida]